MHITSHVIFNHFRFINLPRCSQSINSLMYVYSMQIPSWFLWVLDHIRDRISMYYHLPKKLSVLPPEKDNINAALKLLVKNKKERKKLFHQLSHFKYLWGNRLVSKIEKMLKEKSTEAVLSMLQMLLTQSIGTYFLIITPFYALLYLYLKQTVINSSMSICNRWYRNKI